jgi:ribokinase
VGAELPAQPAAALTSEPGTEPVPARLLVVGSVCADVITTPDGTRAPTLGGAGLYAALAAAAVGCVPVSLAGVVGRDIAASAADCLRPHAVHPVFAVLPGRGLRFDIRYDTNWQAHYTVDAANTEVAITYPIVAAACPDPGAVHLCPTGPPEVQRELAAALRAAHGERLCLSATTFAGRIRSHPATVLALWNLLDVLVCDVLVCDVPEIALLTGRPDLTGALDRAVHVTGGRVTCVADAERGGYLITDATVTRLPAYPAEIVDPTGAGESFAGALSAARLAGHGLLAAAAIAAATASLVGEGFGVARLAHADPAQVQQRAASLAGAFLAREDHRG